MSGFGGPGSTVAMIRSAVVIAWRQTEELSTFVVFVVKVIAFPSLSSAAFAMAAGPQRVQSAVLIGPVSVSVASLANLYLQDAQADCLPMLHGRVAPLVLGRQLFAFVLGLLTVVATIPIGAAFGLEPAPFVARGALAVVHAGSLALLASNVGLVLRDGFQLVNLCAVGLAAALLAPEGGGWRWVRLLVTPYSGALDVKAFALTVCGAALWIALALRLRTLGFARLVRDGSLWSRYR